MNFTPTRRKVLKSGLLTAASLPLAGAASAQAAWPSKPIKIICGYPPGGLTDLFARAYGEYIQEKTGQTVTVETKAGLTLDPPNLKPWKITAKLINALDKKYSSSAGYNAFRNDTFYYPADPRSLFVSGRFDF